MIRARYLLIVLLLGISIVPASAQKTGEMPGLTIAPVWEGLQHPPGWSELQVTLNNEGHDWEGELLLFVARNGVTYRQALVLPAHSNKHYRIPIFMEGQQQIDASLHSKNGDSETYLVEFPSWTIGRNCVAVDAWGTFKFDDKSCGQEVYLDDLRQLPELAMAWEAIDVLIINGMATAELTPEQQESLLAWVAIGGHLIVGGGPALNQSLAGLPSGLQIATVANTKVVPNLTFNTEAGTEIATEVAVTTLTPQTDVTALLQDQNDLLAARASIGAGYIDVLGWDLNLAESQLWLPHLWTKNFVPTTFIWNNSLSAAYRPPTPSLIKIPSSKIPNLRQWMLLLPVSLSVIGFGIFIIASRLKRPILAWVLIPAWIVLTMLVLAFSLNSTFSHRFPLIHEIATIYVPDPDLPARVVQGSAFYTPRVSQLSWTHAGSPRPLAGKFTMRRNNTWSLFAVEINYLEQGSIMRAQSPFGVMTWGSEGLSRAPQISHNLIITTEANSLKISGSLYSDVELHNVLLNLGNKYPRLFLTDIVLSDEEAYLTPTVTKYYTTSHLCDNMPYPLRNIPLYKTEDIYNLPDTPCHIRAEINHVPFPIQNIGGTHLEESCLIYTIPCPRLARGPVEFFLTPRAITKHGWIDPDGYIRTLETTTSIDFIPSATFKIHEVEKITINLFSKYKFYPRGLGELYLWDWKNEIWTPVPLHAASPIIIGAEEASRFFNNDTGVRLQFVPAGDDNANFAVRIKVSGT